MRMLGANLRYGGQQLPNTTTNITRFQCNPSGKTEAAVVFTLGTLGMVANLALMMLILSRRMLRRWSQGLLFHQALVDCIRASLLLPLGLSIMECQPLAQCGLLETSFLLLVTVSTINLLTTVLNDAPLLPEDSDLRSLPLLMDSPQCVFFGAFMIWFASITINLGPTFLSGALAAGSGHRQTAYNPEPTILSGALASCPLVWGPFRHYVLNVLWILINVLCVFLTAFHLRKLYRDITKSSTEAVRVASLVTTMLSIHPPENDICEQRRVRSHIDRVERDAIQRVKMFVVITIGYLIFWGPLFVATLWEPKDRIPTLTHEVTLHIAFVHAIVNPVLFLIMHRGFRKAIADLLCCGWAYRDESLSVPPFPPEEDRSQFQQPIASLNRNYM